MITFLIFPLILVASPIVGMLMTAIICIANCCRLSDAEGAEPIFYVVMIAVIAVIAVFALLFFAAGLWMALPVFAFFDGDSRWTSSLLQVCAVSRRHQGLSLDATAGRETQGSSTVLSEVRSNSYPCRGRTYDDVLLKRLERVKRMFRTAKRIFIVYCLFSVYCKYAAIKRIVCQVRKV